MHNKGLLGFFLLIVLPIVVRFAIMCVGQKLIIKNVVSALLLLLCTAYDDYFRGYPHGIGTAIV